MSDEINHEMITESFALKVIDDLVFGTNAPEFNDGVLKLLQHKRTIYTVSKMDKDFMVVGVSLTTGRVTVSLTNAPNIESQIRSGIIYKRINVIRALKNFNVAFNMLNTIIHHYKNKIPKLVFVVKDEVSMRLTERIFKIGVFRTVMRKYQYRPTHFAEKVGDDTLIYVLDRKPKPKEGEKQPS